MTADVHARSYLDATENSELAKQTHLKPAEAAQTHVFIGFPAETASRNAVKNYQNMKILVGHEREV